MEHDIAKMPGIIHFSLSTEDGNDIIMPCLLWLVFARWSLPHWKIGFLIPGVFLRYLL
jgi:hypothetical protein